MRRPEISDEQQKYDRFGLVRLGGQVPTQSGVGCVVGCRVKEVMKLRFAFCGG